MMFASKPTLSGERVTLRPVGPQYVDGLWELVNDPEIARLTGSHGVIDHTATKIWYGSRHEHADRLDLAICAAEDDSYVGEIVLNDLDAANLSCNLRIALIGPRVFGRGTAPRRSGSCSTTPSPPPTCTGSNWRSTPSTSGPHTSTGRSVSSRRACAGTRCAGTASGTTRS
nr:hypothetical protein GCM10020093_086180 [Planobispora longispora]